MVGYERGSIRDHGAYKNAKTYRQDIVISQLTNKSLHRLCIIIDSPEQNRLIANNDTSLEQSLACLSGDPREFLCMVEVSVERDMLSTPPGLLVQSDQFISPSIIGI